VARVHGYTGSVCANSQKQPQTVLVQPVHGAAAGIRAATRPAAHGPLHDAGAQIEIGCKTEKHFI